VQSGRRALGLPRVLLRVLLLLLRPPLLPSLRLLILLLRPRLLPLLRLLIRSPLLLRLLLPLLLLLLALLPRLLSLLLLPKSARMSSRPAKHV